MTNGDNSSTVVIQRAGGYWKDRIRDYKIRIDGKTVGSISEYDTFSQNTTPGDHDIQLRIDFFRSQTVHLRIAPGETKRLVCAAGPAEDFGQVPGYIKLWEGQLREASPPAVLPPLE